MKFSAKAKSDIFMIGLYQIIGGAISVIMISLSLFNTTKFTELNILVFAFMSIFFVYSIFCGALCLKSKEIALPYSLVNQFLQLLSFAFFGFAFSYVAWLYLTIGFDLSKSIELKFGFGISKFDFNVNRETERMEIDFNLIAFGLIYWASRLRKKIKAAEGVDEIESINSNFKKLNLCFHSMARIKLDLHNIYNNSSAVDKALQQAFEDAISKKIREVEIIPGKGSGQLRKKVERFLQQPHIKPLYHRIENDSKNFGRLFVYFKF